MAFWSLRGEKASPLGDVGGTFGIARGKAESVENGGQNPHGLGDLSNLVCIPIGVSRPELATRFKKEVLQKHSVAQAAHPKDEHPHQLGLFNA
jgi:hypothetical protein